MKRFLLPLVVVGVCSWTFGNAVSLPDPQFFRLQPGVTGHPGEGSALQEGRALDLIAIKLIGIKTKIAIGQLQGKVQKVLNVYRGLKTRVEALIARVEFLKALLAASSTTSTAATTTSTATTSGFSTTSSTLSTTPSTTPMSTTASTTADSSTTSLTTTSASSTSSAGPTSSTVSAPPTTSAPVTTTTMITP